MSEDATLLRRYAEERSEPAFAELVGRHLDLVYGAALRRTGDPHRAADVAQQVFTSLARDARRLARHPVLPAWLHTATRNAALNLMISEKRRLARERAAAALAVGDQSDHWERLRPVLDEAIDELSSPDREAVVLRFLERREFSDIGHRLNLSADAARMRTGRALEKLRAGLARRGITSTAAALGAAVAGQPLLAAPAGLAQAVTTAALTGTVSGAAGTTLATLMTTKITVTAIVAGLFAYGAGAYFGLGGRAGNRHSPAAVPVVEPQTIASLHRANDLLQAELDRVDAANVQLTANLAQLRAAAPTIPNSNPAPAKNLSLGLTPRELKINILNNLRQVAAARDQYRLEHNASPASVETLVGDAGYIRRLATVGGEDYSALNLSAAGPLSVTTPDGTVVTYDPAGPGTTVPDPPNPMEIAQEMMQKVGPAVGNAVAAYQAANPGQNPPSPEALTPYFTNPADATAFAEARAAIAAAHAAPPR